MINYLKEWPNTYRNDHRQRQPLSCLWQWPEKSPNGSMKMPKRRKHLYEKELTKRQIQPNENDPLRNTLWNQTPQSTTDNTKAQRKRLNNRVWVGHPHAREMTSIIITTPTWPGNRSRGQRSVDAAWPVPALRACIGQVQGKRLKGHLDFPGSESSKDKSSASSTSGPKPLVIRVRFLFRPIQEIFSDVCKP